MHFRLELSQGLYYMLANSKSSGAGSPESLLVAYVITIRFSVSHVLAHVVCDT